MMNFFFLWTDDVNAAKLIINLGKLFNFADMFCDTDFVC